MIFSQAAYAPPERFRVLGRFGVPLIAFAGIALIVLFLLAILLRSVTLIGTEDGLSKLAGIFFNADYYGILFNTFYFAAITTTASMLVGVPVAWLTERTELPGRDLVRVFLATGMLIPGFFTAMGWQFLLHPRIGMINVWLHRTFGVTINVATFTGMGLLQGLALATLVFVVTAPAIAAIDPTLEESGEVHGLGAWSRLVSITLPVIAPALAASALLTFIVALEEFDIPAVIGLSNKLMLYSTYIYSLVNPNSGVPAYELAAASSLPMLVLAVGLSTLYYRFMRQSYRYQVVLGKAYRRKRARMSRSGALLAWAFIGIYLTLTIVLPLATVAWVSFLPYFQPFSMAAIEHLSLNNYRGLLIGAFWKSVGNTVILSVVAPGITVLFSLAISWMITRRYGLLGRWFEVISFLPLSIPSVIFAVAGILVALRLGAYLPIYGTIWLVVVVECIIRISSATRITNGAMLQIHKELEEAGAVFGLSATTRFTRILLPLLAPAIVYCWFYLALLAFRDLTVPLLLTSPANETISVYIWGLLGYGSYGPASALTISIVLSILALALVAAATAHIVGRGRTAATPVEPLV